MAGTEEVLSLTTVVKRRIVIIDGKSMEMLDQDEVRLDAAVRLRHVLEAFRDKTRITEEGALILSRTLQKAVRDVIPSIPKEIDDKLSDENRIDIIVTFFKATGTPAPKTADSHPPVAS